MILREGTNDATSVVEDVKEYEKLRIEGCVLDLGGHIGLFADYALERGAWMVTSVEPEPDNIATYRANMQGRSLLLEGAIVGNNDARRQLYINSGRNKAWHTLQPLPGRASISVVCYNFNNLLTAICPDVLKVDIEGTEYELNWELPRGLGSVAVEFHDLPERQPEADAILHTLRKQNFFVTYVTPIPRRYKLYILER